MFLGLFMRFVWSGWSESAIFMLFCVYVVRWVGEEWKPVLDLVEQLWDEDEVGEVVVFAFDPQTSQSDIFVVFDIFRL